VSLMARISPSAIDMKSLEQKVQHRRGH
jgi:hypothetical protein